MASKIHLKVITPNELVVNEEVDEVVAPGELGEFGVLPGHIPLISTLLNGELRYKQGGVERKLEIEGGIADVRDDKVNIVTEKANHS